MSVRITIKFCAILHTKVIRQYVMLLKCALNLRRQDTMLLSRIVKGMNKMNDESKAGVLAFVILAFVTVALFTGHGAFVLGIIALCLAALISESLIGIIKEEQRRKSREVRSRYENSKKFAVEMALIERNKDTK